MLCLGSTFLLPNPMVLKLKSKRPGRSLRCYPPPSTCTGTNCSPPGMQWSKYCIMFIEICDPPETPELPWSLWAQQDTGLLCKALQTPWAVRREDFIPHWTPLYCGVHQVPGSGNWCDTLFYSRYSGERIELQNCTLETAAELPSYCRDTHSRSFWASKWCLSLAKPTSLQWVDTHCLKEYNKVVTEAWQLWQAAFRAFQHFRQKGTLVLQCLGLGIGWGGLFYPWGGKCAGKGQLRWEASSWGYTR